MNQAFQVAMARLYTEPTVRQALYRGDASAFEAGELSSNEVAALRDFARDNRDRLELYSGFLVKKRTVQPRKRFPVLSAALDAVMPDGWDRTWATYNEGLGEGNEASVQEGEQDLVAFAESIVPRLGAGESVVRDALRYERIKRELLAAEAPAHDSPRRVGCPWVSGPFAIGAFEHDLLALVNEARDGRGPVRSRAIEVLFWLHPTKKQVSTVSATKELGVLVGACDGWATLAELTIVLQRAGVMRASDASVAAAVGQLVKVGLLGMTEGKQAP